jgi:hypothetical protein
MGSINYRCNGTTNCGKRCKLKRKFRDFCNLHENQELQAKETEMCAICFDNIKTKIVLDCGHSFCKICILKWMCKNFSCPLCRECIDDDYLLQQSFSYGLRNKLLVRMEQCYMNISELPEREKQILGFLGINVKTFMGEIEWQTTKPYIDPSVLEKINSRTLNVIMKINDLEEWNYFKQFKKVYLFD